MARSGTVRVNIVADADGVRKGTREAERDLERLNTRGRASFHGLGVAAKGSALAIGAAGLAVGDFAVGVIKAGADSEAAMARQKRAVENAGIAWEGHRKQIDATIQKLSELSAFDDEDLSDSFSKLVVATKDVNEALKLNATVADVARGRQIDLNAANSLVLKAFNGNAGALKRLGIEAKPVTDAQDRLAGSTKKATAEQKEQAKEQDRQATRLSLIAKLQQAYGGQAKAYGDTTSGSLARIGVAWENLQETVGNKAGPIITRTLNALTQVLNRQGPAWEKVRAAGQVVVDWYKENLEPTVRDVTKTIQAIWARFGDALTQITKTGLGRVLRATVDNLKNLRDVVQGIMALLRGDWGEAWSKLSAIPVRVFKGIISDIKALGSQFLAAAKALGQAIVDGILAGLRAVGGEIKDFILSLIPSPADILDALGISGGRNPRGTSPIVTRSRAAAPGQPGGPRRAMGGFLPGIYQGRDTMTIRAAPGEVILNPAQQRIVGIDRIMGALRRTGGVTGGDSFARGGVLQGAITFGRAQLNDPYVFGAGHGGGDSSAWDCSGLASAIANQIPGYSGGFGDTDSLYASSSAATGSEPVLFGFAHPGAIQGGVKKQWGHMFIKVGNEYFNAHSPGLGIDQRPSPGAVYRVPAGLEGIAGDAGDRIASGGRVRTVAGSKGPSAASRAGTIAGGIGAAVSGILGGLGRAGGAAIAGPLAAVRDVPTGLSDAAQTRITSAGITGATNFAKARANAGLTTDADQLREAKEDAIREATKREVNKELKETMARKHKVNGLIARISARIKKLAKGMPAKGPQRAAVINALARLRAQRRKLRNELSGLIAYEVELRNQLQDLDIEALADAAEGQDAAEAAAAEVGTSADTGSAPEAAAPTDTGPSADQAAQLAQAEERARVAGRGLGLAEDFIRTALGPRDISGPGVSITLNTLVPAGPTQLAAISDAVLAALGAAGNVPSSTVLTGV